MKKNEWFNLPSFNVITESYKDKEFDKNMALALLNEVQKHWCVSRHNCKNYLGSGCTCFFPTFKKIMIEKINDHFDGKKSKQKERREWIEDYDKITCPNCKHSWDLFDNCTDTFKYCPNCGEELKR